MISSADNYAEETPLFQLVRRRAPVEADPAKCETREATAKETLLSKALIAVLSVNVFMLSGVLSFCVFVFWYQ